MSETQPQPIDPAIGPALIGQISEEITLVLGQLGNQARALSIARIQPRVDALDKIIAQAITDRKLVEKLRNEITASCQETPAKPPEVDHA